jgi:hypothetical protein
MRLLMLLLLPIDKLVWKMDGLPVVTYPAERYLSPAFLPTEANQWAFDVSPVAAAAVGTWWL